MQREENYTSSNVKCQTEETTGLVHWSYCRKSYKWINQPNRLLISLCLFSVFQFLFIFLAVFVLNNDLEASGPYFKSYFPFNLLHLPIFDYMFSYCVDTAIIYIYGLKKRMYFPWIFYPFPDLDCLMMIRDSTKMAVP